MTTTKQEKNQRRRYLRAVRKFEALQDEWRSAPQAQRATIAEKIAEVELHIAANYSRKVDHYEIYRCFLLFSHEGLGRLPDDPCALISFPSAEVRLFLEKADVAHVQTAVQKGWNPGGSLPLLFAWAKGDAARESYICDELAVVYPLVDDGGVTTWLHEELYTTSDAQLLGRCLAAQIKHHPDIVESAAHDAAINCYTGVVRILLRAGAPRPTGLEQTVFHPVIVDELNPPSNHVALARRAEGQDVASLISRTVADPDQFPEQSWKTPRVGVRR